MDVTDFVVSDNLRDEDIGGEGTKDGLDQRRLVVNGHRTGGSDCGFVSLFIDRPIVDIDLLPVRQNAPPLV